MKMSSSANSPIRGWRLCEIEPQVFKWVIYIKTDSWVVLQIHSETKCTSRWCMAPIRWWFELMAQLRIRRQLKFRADWCSPCLMDQILFKEHQAQIHQLFLHFSPGLPDHPFYYCQGMPTLIWDQHCCWINLFALWRRAMNQNRKSSCNTLYKYTVQLYIDQTLACINTACARRQSAFWQHSCIFLILITYKFWKPSAAEMHL